MDESHQDKAQSKTLATEDELWLPPLSPKDQEKLSLRKHRKKAKQPLIIIGISAAFATFVGAMVLIYWPSWVIDAWIMWSYGPLWVHISLILIGIMLLILLIILLIRVGYTAQWPGFKGKTLWDWLQRLV